MVQSNEAKTGGVALNFDMSGWHQDARLARQEDRARLHPLIYLNMKENL